MSLQNEKTIDVSEIENHLYAVKELFDFIGTHKIIVFDAPMGAGKTTFIKSICNYLDVNSALSSPTYSIVNEYDTLNNEKIFHFDLYRLNSINELYDIGFEEYLDSNNYIFIEWPELAIPFLDTYVSININTINNKRYLYVKIIKPK